MIGFGLQNYHHKNFLWKITSDILPTKLRLNRYFNRVPSQCVLCEDLDEDTNHLLFQCSFTRKLYAAIHELKLLRFCESEVSYNLFHNIEKAKKYSNNFNLLCFIWWGIWKTRNNNIFASARQDNPYSIAISSYNNWKNAQNSVSNNNRSPTTRNRKNYRWRKPTQGYVKVNFDASWSSTGSSTGGIIIRDSSGTVISIGRHQITSTKPLIAEATAMLEAVKKATLLNINKLIIEGDCLTLINAVRGVWKVPWEITNLVNDICNYLNLIPHSIVQHCLREGIRLRISFLTYIFVMWMLMFPYFLGNFVQSSVRMI